MAETDPQEEGDLPQVNETPELGTAAPDSPDFAPRGRPRCRLARVRELPTTAALPDQALSPF